MGQRHFGCIDHWDCLPQVDTIGTSVIVNIENLALGGVYMRPTGRTDPTCKADFHLRLHGEILALHEGLHGLQIFTEMDSLRICRGGGVRVVKLPPRISLTPLINPTKILLHPSYFV